MKKINERNTKFTSTTDELKEVYKQVGHLKVTVENLKLENEKLRRIIYGSRSEKITPQEDENPNQKTLFDTLVLTEDKEEPPPKKKKQKRPGRKPAPKHFEERIVIEEAPIEKTFDKLGNKLSLLGYEESKRLEFVPATFVNVITKREKWGHKDSRELVFIVPPPKAIVAKGKFTDSFLHHIVFQKFFMSIPLYRQIQDYRGTGLDISKSVLSDLVKRFSGFYKAIVEAIRIEILNQKYAQGDETPIKCQGLKKGKMKDGYFWVFRNQVGCYFHYGETKGHEQLEKVFEVDRESLPEKFYFNEETKRWEWIGYFLSDGAKAYPKMFENTKTIEMGCWSHTRRYFYDIREMALDANWFLKKIGKLYKIEKDIKEQSIKENWDDSTFYLKRGIERKEKSEPIVLEIEVKVNEFLNSGSLPPKDPLNVALGYAFNQMEKLKVFLTDGELPIDNNLSEQSIKSVVIGRKNYLFVGSEDAGRWGATCYSLTESCRILGIDPRDYFEKATLGIHNGESPRNLTPYALKDQIRSLPKNH